MIGKVALFYPASQRYSGYLSTHRMPGLVTSHSGLTILAQVLRHRGLEVRVYDEKITPFDETLLDGVDLVGLSLQTSWAPRGYRIAKRVRSMGKPVVLGGVHATLNPDEAIAHADYVVRGEGEHTFPELIDALNGVGDLAQVRGLSYWAAGLPKHNPSRPNLTTEELDRVPWPRQDLIEGINQLLRYPLNRIIYSTMLTRGCDQACTYCSITRVFGQSLRHRSVGNFIAELKAHFDPKRQVLFFTDDSLAVDREFLKQVLAALIDEKLVPRLGWHSQLRADVAQDAELLRLMRATNCLFVTCGFESINAKSLKSLAKGQTPNDVRWAIRRLREHGVIVNGFFMFGTDHDEPSAMAETVRFAQEAGCALAGFMPLTPFPGTPTFTKLEREGRIFTKDWELYDVQHVVFQPRKMSAWELYWRTLACYPAFYSSGRHMLRQVFPSMVRPLSPEILLVGLTWPIVKQLCWSREVLANWDYMRDLRRMASRADAA
jgi:radical SAM superfamily enzyme YgiQ (UPF0313 family)